MAHQTPWEPVTSVPDRLEGKRRLALQFLLTHASRVEIRYVPRGRSQYRASFDDGVGRGSFVYSWDQAALTPLAVYLSLANTGWPGFQLDWLETCAERHMARACANEKP
jgi:hypothetical protein